MTGWVPGAWSWLNCPYSDPKIFCALLLRVREITRITGQRDVSIQEVHEHFRSVESRLITLHLLTLIEDGLGLVAVDTERSDAGRADEVRFRLATWREAMKGSRQLIKDYAFRHQEDVFLPKVSLRLTESFCGCDWYLIGEDVDHFTLMEIVSPYRKASGPAPSIDSWLREFALPDGWAATWEKVSDLDRQARKLSDREKRGREARRRVGR